MDDCIDNDVLSDYFEKHRSEVFDMLLFTYDEKLHKKTIREEGREEGRIEAINAVMDSLNVDKEKAMDILKISEEERGKYRV